MVVQKWLIDTDVLIDYLRGNPKAVEFLRELVEESTCCISSITIAELYIGVKEGIERNILDIFIKQFEVIVLDGNIAIKGGLLRRKFGKNHGTGLVDALIAASAEEFTLKLITLNKKHFPMLNDVRVPYSK